VVASCTLSGFKVDNEQSLLALNFGFWILPFLLHAYANRTGMIAKIDFEPHQFGGICHILDSQDGSDPDIDLS
jgi:hypothetical protein